ncbi:hypothetical protein [Neobacillus citreus]|uniref:Uncharacterized protein n=1 Tax=Neobacillus citreus TaxID=2833578 RepID=A0A942YC82_9BACI|nr:hypothetical protein [Neobacillus citreus]MCH6268965.1 hypothetical protein [Neobacillus citreus]
MIKDKKSLSISIILYLAVIILNLPFPDQSPLGETLASKLHIPVRSANGLHYFGISLFILFILSLYFLSKSLKKYKTRFIVIAFLAVSFIPTFLAASIQKYFATGIYSVAYNHNEGRCHFEIAGEKTLHGECVLPFENYSSKPVGFTIEFYDTYDDEFLTLMNVNAPYTVKLDGKESNRVEIEADIDVSKMKNHIDSADVNGVNIIIKSGGKSRKL